MELWTQLHEKQEASVREIVDHIFRTEVVELSEQADLKQQIENVILSKQMGKATRILVQSSQQ